MSCSCHRTFTGHGIRFEGLILVSFLHVYVVDVFDFVSMFLHLSSLLLPSNLIL